MLKNDLSNLFLFNMMFFLMMALHADQDDHSIDEIPYHVNRYGDIFPHWPTIHDEELRDKLLAFIETFKEKKQAIILQIPHERSPILNAISRAGFTFHGGDQKGSTWIVKNGSSIPLPFTAISGAHVIVLKEGKVLVLEERTRRGILGFPAGGTERGEFARETAQRELYEEVGLHVQPEDLKLIALINRKNGNLEGANHLGHCYLTQNVAGEICLDPIEIVQAFWISVNDLAEASEIQGLKISPYMNALGGHILNGCRFSYSAQLLDIRQTLLVNDPLDYMNVEFFQQNL